MASILKPECNFLHGYFRCLLPIETVDVEVKIKWCEGSTCSGETKPPLGHILQPLEHKTHPYPFLIRKMKTYLELEGKLGNQPCTNIFVPNKNSSPRKALANKRLKRRGEPKHQWREGFRWEWLPSLCPQIQLCLWTQPCLLNLPYSSYFYGDNPNTSGKFSSHNCHILTSNSIYFSPRKVQENPLSHKKIPRGRRSICPQV